MSGWSLSLAGEPPKTLTEAKKRMAEIQRDIHQIIEILTAEQALRAQRVVREAGKKK